MANEISWRGKVTGATNYFTIRRAADNYMWDTDQDAGPLFQSMLTANWYHASAAAGNYWIAMSEAPAGSYLYKGSWPTTGNSPDVDGPLPGFHYVDIYRQAGANPAISDTLVGTIYGWWNGTKFEPAAADVYQVAATAQTARDLGQGVNAATLAGVVPDMDEAGKIAARVRSFQDNADAEHNVEFGGDTNYPEVYAQNAGAGGGLTAQETRDAMELASTVGTPSAGSIDTKLGSIYSEMSKPGTAQTTDINAKIGAKGGIPALDAATGLKIVGYNAGNVETAQTAKFTFDASYCVNADTIYVNGAGQTGKDLGNALPAVGPGTIGGLPVLDANQLAPETPKTNKLTFDLISSVNYLKVTVYGFVGSLLTGTAAYLRAAFDYFFNVVTPAKTVNDVGGGNPSVVYSSSLTQATIANDKIYIATKTGFSQSALTANLSGSLDVSDTELDGFTTNNITDGAYVLSLNSCVFRNGWMFNEDSHTYTDFKTGTKFENMNIDGYFRIQNGAYPVLNNCKFGLYGGVEQAVLSTSGSSGTAFCAKFHNCAGSILIKSTSNVNQKYLFFGGDMDITIDAGCGVGTIAIEGSLGIIIHQAGSLATVTYNGVAIAAGSTRNIPAKVDDVPTVAQNADGVLDEALGAHAGFLTTLVTDTNDSGRYSALQSALTGLYNALNATLVSIEGSGWNGATDALRLIRINVDALAVAVAALPAAPSAATIASTVMGSSVDGSFTLTKAIKEILAKMTGDPTKVGNAYQYHDKATGALLFTLTEVGDQVTRS